MRQAAGAPASPCLDLPPEPESPRFPRSDEPRSGRLRHAGVALSAVLGALLLGAAAPVGERLQVLLRGDPDPTELALFPTGPWVRPLACGFNELVADVVWLRALQYYGEHRGSDQRYPYLQTLFQTLTDLDPHFINAYIFGAITLADDQHQQEEALELLRKGMAANPRSWWLVFEYGFLHYALGEDPPRAGHWLARAARMPDAPEWVSRLAAHASTKSGDRATALALWLEIHRNTDNPEIRRIAADYLAGLGHPDFPSSSEPSAAAPGRASQLDSGSLPSTPERSR